MDTFKNETFQAGPCDILQQKERIYLYVEFVIYFIGVISSSYSYSCL